MIYASTPESLMFQLKTIAATSERGAAIKRVTCNYNGKVRDIRLWLCNRPPVDWPYWYGVDVDDYRYLCNMSWEDAAAIYNASIIC